MEQCMCEKMVESPATNGAVHNWPVDVEKVKGAEAAFHFHTRAI